MAIPMDFNPGVLPPGFCPTSEQSRWNAYAAAAQITFPLTLGNFSTGNTAPTEDMQVFPWYRSNGDGSPDGWYSYFNGSWVRPNPVAANDVAAIRFHPGPYASIDTYDGGESGVVTSDSGPMWAVIGQTTGGSTDYGSMGGKVPVGVSADFGEAATGNPPAGVTGTGGKITLQPIHIPAHPHDIIAQFPRQGVSSGGNGAFPNSNGTAQSGFVTGGNSTGNDGNGDPNPPTAFYGFPWLAGYWIARTGRIFYQV